VDPSERQPTRDAFLDDYLEKYDRWLERGAIRFSSRIVPIGEALKAEPWIVPGEQVRSMLRSAWSIAVQDCVCRAHYRRCDRPVEVCLALDENAERGVEAGTARRLSLAEAEERIALADRSGLVHMTLYVPQEKVSAICNCCPCCCHEIQLLKRYGRVDLVARSDFVAKTDEAACVGCGECVRRCAFDARSMDGGRLRVDESACYGCGVCVPACPTGAIRLVRRGMHLSAPPPREAA
jgi:ferredoxin